MSKEQTEEITSNRNTTLLKPYKPPKDNPYDKKKQDGDGNSDKKTDVKQRRVKNDKQKKKKEWNNFSQFD